MFDWIPSEHLTHLALSIVGSLLWLILTFLVAMVVKIYRRQKQQEALVQRKLRDNTQVLIYGLFDGQVQSDVLGSFLSTLFGPLEDLVVGWNDRPSPHVVLPGSEYEANYLEELLVGHASTHLLPCAWILQGYLKNAQPHGPASYQYGRLVVGVLRPDADQLACHDRPQVAIVEEETLRRILQEDPKPQHPTRDAAVWLEAIQELGREYLVNKKRGIGILEFPLPAMSSATRTAPL